MNNAQRELALRYEEGPEGFTAGVRTFYSNRNHVVGTRFVRWNAQMHKMRFMGGG